MTHFLPGVIAVHRVDGMPVIQRNTVFVKLLRDGGNMVMQERKIKQAGRFPCPLRNLPQRPLGDPGIAAAAVGLPVVAAEMFGAGRDALGLDAPNHGGGQLTGHQRIFRIILEIPAAEGASVDIDGGTATCRWRFP